VRRRDVAADLMDPRTPAEVVARAVEQFGGLDILVNNAGGAPPGDRIPHGGFLDRTDEQWRAMFEFNLFAAVLACRAALPVMLERGGGAIVNVSSGTARQPQSFNVDYSGAKAALANLTKALSADFAPRGVRVNGVCPGPVLTAWWTDDEGAADIIAAMTDSNRDEVITTLAQGDHDGARARRRGRPRLDGLQEAGVDDELRPGPRNGL
jgi:NAD(P)-dependent dehydrogenase (short-subunit alcohol dehydrogenase family)